MWLPVKRTGRGKKSWYSCDVIYWWPLIYIHLERLILFVIVVNSRCYYWTWTVDTSYRIISKVELLGSLFLMQLYNVTLSKLNTYFTFIHSLYDATNHWRSEFDTNYWYDRTFRLQSDLRDIQGKWPLARKPDRSLSYHHIIIKFFFLASTQTPRSVGFCVTLGFIDNKT